MEVKQGPQEWRAAKTVGAPADTANTVNLIPENCTASVIAAPHHRQRRPPTSSKMGKGAFILHDNVKAWKEMLIDVSLMASSRIPRPCRQSQVSDPQGRKAGEEEDTKGTC